MFLAACSHGTFCSLEDVLTTAFEALDERRCGVLSVQGVARLLPRCDTRVMQRLPQDRNFTVYDWVACIQMSSQATVRAVQPRPRRAMAPGLFDQFFYWMPRGTNCRALDGTSLGLALFTCVMPLKLQ